MLAVLSFPKATQEIAQEVVPVVTIPTRSRHPTVTLSSYFALVQNDQQASKRI